MVYVVLLCKSTRHRIADDLIAEMYSQLLSMLHCHRKGEGLLVQSDSRGGGVAAIAAQNDRSQAPELLPESEGGEVTWVGTRRSDSASAGTLTRKPCR